MKLSVLLMRLMLCLMHSQLKYLSFEGFVSALQEISYKLYGKTSSKNELKQVLRHCV